RGILDGDDVGTGLLIDAELATVAAEGTLFRTLQPRILAEAEGELDLAHRSHASQERVEFGILLQAQGCHDPPAKIFRFQDGHLAGYDSVVDGIGALVVERLHTIKGRFEVLNQYQSLG